MQNILVTGCAGHSGGFLLKYATSVTGEDQGLYGTDVRVPKDPRALGDRFIPCDLRDIEQVKELVARVRPARVFHLGAIVPIKHSLDDPAATYEVNVIGTSNLFETLARGGLGVRVLVASSSEVYGQVAPQGNPITEECPTRPVNPYGVSKLAQEAIGFMYDKTTEIEVVVARTFGLTGPGQPPIYACSSFAKQIAEIEAGLRPAAISVGNLEAVRDYTDVRDVVRAYWEILGTGRRGRAWNVCSGTPVRMRAVLDGLLAWASRRVSVAVDPDRLRPLDVPRLFGNSSRIRTETSWRPEIPFATMLRDLLQDWRDRVSGENGPNG